MYFYFRQEKAKYGCASEETYSRRQSAYDNPERRDSDEALTHALEAIGRVQQGLANNLSGDFVAQDIRECIFHLSDIAGEVTNDMVLQNIFQHFCIGK